MDKYEFNIKVEQIRKMTEEGDYVTAMKIADSIDWSRVRNANLLSMIAGVYEKNGEYQEAKDILLLAFERAPVGKRLLFKLTELSVKSGDLEEAEDFYKEFRDLAPEDTRASLLEYLILKARHAAPEELLAPLERFTSQELDEKWLYELAELYARAGMGEACIRTCDRITLLFGMGQYSERAMQLKQNFAELSDYQKELSGTMPDYREISYDAEMGSAAAAPQSADDDITLRAEAEAADSDALASQRYADEDAEFEAYLRAHEAELSGVSERAPESARERTELPKTEAPVYDRAEELREKLTAGLSREITRLSEEQTAAAKENAAEPEDVFGKTQILDEQMKQRLRRVVIRAGEPEEMPGAQKPDVQAVMKGAKAQAAEIAGAAAAVSAAAESAAPKLSEAERGKEAAAPRPQARVEFRRRETAEIPEDPQRTERPEAGQPVLPQSRAAAAQKEEKRPAVPMRSEAAEAKAAENAEKVAAHGPFHMIVESEDAAAGLAIAIDELRYIHNEYGITNAAAKTTAGKLNQKGLPESALAKLRGRDFIVEQAGALRPELLETICDLVRDDQSGMIIVLVDTPEGLDRMEENCPELFDLCDLVSDECDGEEMTAEPEQEAEAPSGEEETAEIEEAPEKETEPKEEPQSRASAKGVKAKKNSVVRKTEVSGGQEMEIDDFAQYCCEYAASIDCSITGKSMLALYERIELMEEDNIPLTRETAEELIEEVADHAEKPPIGKRLKGMFNAKYDKNGLLILKEEDFIH